MDLIDALKNAEQELALEQKNLAETQARIEQLQVEIRGLNLAIARHENEDAHTTIFRLEELLPENSWQHLDRTEAILRLLREEGPRPLSPSEIAGLLRTRGRRNDRPHAVSASLNYLKRLGKATNAQRGKWMLATNLDQVSDEGEISSESEKRPDD